jgi:hypothetical protein
MVISKVSTSLGNASWTLVNDSMVLGVLNFLFFSPYGIASSSLWAVNDVVDF